MIIDITAKLENGFEFVLSLILQIFSSTLAPEQFEESFQQIDADKIWDHFGMF